MSLDSVTLIRDIAIVVMAVMVSIAAATVTVVVLKIYPKVKRAAHNLETSSRLLMDATSRISSLLNTGAGLGIFLWDLIGRLGNRKKSDPQAEGGEDP